MTTEQTAPSRGQQARRALTVAGLAVVMTAATALPAAAGGWWTYPQMEQDELAIGESVTVTADVMFPSTEHAEEATGSGEHFAYLVRGIDEAGLRDAMWVAQPEDDWWATPTETIRLAPLVLDRGSSNLGAGTATFVVPEVEPGFYDVMLCSAGCSEPLADVVPLRGIYVGDAAIVRVLRDAQPATEHVLSELETVQSELGHLTRETETIDSGITEVDGTVAGLTTSVQRLTADVAALETRTAEGERAAQQPWWASTAWFVAGVAVASVAMWLARRRSAAEENDQDDGNGPGEVVGRAPPDDRAGSEPELVTFDLP